MEKLKTKIINCAFAASFIVASCRSDSDFKKAARELESQGYTDIKNTGHSFFCCDENDDFSTGFTAKDKNGNTVKGCICSGMTKGITLRVIIILNS